MSTVLTRKFFNTSLANKTTELLEYFSSKNNFKTRVKMSKYCANRIVFNTFSKAVYVLLCLSFENEIQAKHIRTILR